MVDHVELILQKQHAPDLYTRKSMENLDLQPSKVKEKDKIDYITIVRILFISIKSLTTRIRHDQFAHFFTVQKSTNMTIASA